MFRTIALVSATALAAALTPSLASAQSEDAAADATPLESASPERLSGERLSGSGEAPVLMGDLALSLAQAIEMGLENNLDVQIARFDPLTAEQDSLAAWGAYDPTLRSETGYSFARPPGLATTATESKVVDGVFGVGGQVPLIGATLDLAWNGNRTRNNFFFRNQDPTWTSSLELSASVPLMRNLIWNESWTQVKTTRLGAEAAGSRFEASVMTTVAQIESKYWELVAATEQDLVATKSLETARALLDQVQTQYDVGVVSKVDVVEAEAGVAEREVNLIRQSNIRSRSQDELIDLVLGPHLSATSTMKVVPTDRPENFVEYAVDMETAARRALAKRPELAEAQATLDQQDLQVRFAKNQRLPQLDFQAAYATGGERGIGGGTRTDFNTGQQVVIPTNGRGIEDSFNDYFENDGQQDYSFRGVFSIPIPNTVGRANVRKARFAHARAERQLVRTRQDIILEVRNGARDLLSSQQGIVAARRRQAAAAEQLRAEKIRLEHGESTPFDVLQRESSLVDAESQLIAAYQLYRSSVTQLERAQGTILESRNIVIDEVKVLR